MEKASKIEEQAKQLLAEEKIVAQEIEATSMDYGGLFAQNFGGGGEEDEELFAAEIEELKDEL